MIAAVGPGPSVRPMLAVSTTELTIRMVVGLAVVAFLLFVLTRITRRVLDGRGGLRPAITVRHQQRLDKHASVTLLTAGERTLLVGTAGQAVVLLAEGDDLLGPDRSRVEAAEASREPSIDVRSGRQPATGPNHDDTTDGGWGRPRPIRALQNMTVRRS